MAGKDDNESARNSTLLKAGFAAGIGSAAIAAALLYVTRAKKAKKARGSPPPTD